MTPFASRVFSPLTTLFRFSGIALVSALLTSCISNSEPPPPLSKTITNNVEEVVTAQSLDDAGALAIVVLGAQNFPLIYTLNDIPVATQYKGYIWLPLMPGTHKFHARQASFNFPTTQIAVKKGEITYMVIDNSWFGDTPYKLGSRPEFLKDLKDRPTRPDQVVLKNPVHAFLPANLKSLLDGCGPQSIETMCKRALKEIPEILISENRRAQILALMNSKPAASAVAKVEPQKIQPQSPAPAPATQSAKAAATWALPPAVRRDQLMVQISDLFNAGKPEAALPYFIKLDTLPVPIDATTEYYWAQALLASGDEQGAFKKLSRFVRKIETTSDYYQPAIRLLTKIKG